MFDTATSPQLAPILPLEGARSTPSRIAVKSNGRILFTDPAEVATVEAQGNYVLLRRISGRDLLLREPLSTVAEKLLPYGFVRIHRSALVNASFIEEIQSWTTGDYVLRIKGGREFHVSRTFKKNLHSITPLWLGTAGFSPG
jgi:two-component system LytT family response regulator